MPNTEDTKLNEKVAERVAGLDLVVFGKKMVGPKSANRWKPAQWKRPPPDYLHDANLVLALLHARKDWAIGEKDGKYTCVVYRSPINPIQGEWGEADTFCRAACLALLKIKSSHD
jgi:hypothetical protein